jgi:hypothetical protein
VLSGAEQQEALRSAAYWAEQAHQAAPPTAPTPVIPPPTMPAAPVPTSAPAAAAVVPVPPPAAHFVGQPAVVVPDPIAPRGTLMTRGVWITIGVVAVLVLGTIVGGSVVVSQRASALAAAQGPDAKAVTARYLDAAIAGDDAVTAALRKTPFSHGSTAVDDPSEFIVGDPLAAKAVGLKIGYDIVQVNYYDDLDREPIHTEDAASAIAIVKLDYTFTAEGKKTDSWGLQTVLLSRGHFDARTGADRGPIVVLSDGPTVPGPWTVSGFGALPSGSGDFPKLDTPSEMVGSSYAAADSPNPHAICSVSRSIVLQVASTAVRQGVIPADCFAGGTAFQGMTQEQLDFLTANLVPLDDAPVEDITGLGGFLIGDDQVDAPFSEWAFTLGSRQFVFTIAMIDPATALKAPESDIMGDHVYRVIAVTERTGK